MKKNNKFFKIIKWTTAGLLVSIGLLITVILVLLYRPPSFVINYIKKTVQETVIKSTGLYLSIEEIPKLSIRFDGQDLAIRNVTLNRDASSKSAYFAKIGGINLKFDALSFFLWHKNALLQASITDPQIQLILDKNGKLKFYPKLGPSAKKEEKKGPLPRIPQIELALKNGGIVFKDESKIHPFDTIVNIPNITTQVETNYDLKLALHILCEKLDLSINAQTNISKGNTKASLTFKEDKIERWAKYFLKSPEYSISSGKLALKINAGFQDWNLNKIKLDSNINISNLTAVTNQVNMPVSLPAANISITEKKTSIDVINLYCGQDLLVAAGDVIYPMLPELIPSIMKDTKKLKDKKYQAGITNKLIRNIGMNLDLTLPSVNLSKLLYALPYKVKKPIKSLGGTLMSNIRVKGTPLNPYIDGYIKLNDLDYNGIGVNSFYTRLNFLNKNLIVSDLVANLFNGTLKGNASVNIAYRQPSFKGHVDIKNVSVGDVIRSLKVKVPPQYCPELYLTSNISFNGTPKNPNASGSIESNRISFPQSKQLPTITGTRIKFVYKNNNADALLDIDHMTFPKSVQNIKIQGTRLKCAYSKTKTNALLDINRIAFASSDKMPHFFNTRLAAVYRNKDADATFSTVSEEAGNIRIVAKLLKNNLKGSALILNLPLKTIHNWVPDLEMKSGKMDLTSDFNGSLPAISKNLSNLTANAKIIVKDAYAVYTLKPKAKMKKTTNVISAENKANLIRLASNPVLKNDRIYSKSLSAYTQVESSFMDTSTKFVTASPSPIKNKPQVFHQKIDKLVLDAHLKNGVLDLAPETSIKAGKTKLKLWGKMYPLAMIKAPRSGKNKNGLPQIKGNLGEIFLHSDDINLADFPSLKNWDINAGHIYFDAHAKYKDNNLTANLDTNINKFATKDVVIDNVTANAKFENNKLNIKKISVLQGNEQINVIGNIDMTSQKDPVLDLNLTMKDFGLNTVFSFLPKDYFRKKEEETRKTIIIPPDSTPVVYGLPQSNNIKVFTVNRPFEDNKFMETLKTEDLTKLSYSDLSVPLSENLEHWKRNKELPLTADEKPVITVTPPFWEMIKGNLSAKVYLKGKASDPRIDMVASLSDGEIYKRFINEIFLDASLKNQKLNLKKIHIIENEGGYMEASGNLDLKKKTIDMEASGNMNLNWANSWLKASRTNLQGNSKLLIGVDGSFDNPHVIMSTDVTSGLVNDIYFDSLTGLMEYLNGNFQITYASLSSGGKEVRLSGFVPIKNKNKPMDITVTMEDDSFGIISVVSKDIEWLKGKGNALIRVTGVPEAPQLDGKIKINGGKIYLNSLKEAIDEINTDISINTNQVNIEKLTALYSKGEINAQGTIDLMKYIPSFLDLKIKTDHLNIVKAPLNAVVSTDITIKNELTNPAIGGKVTLEKGEVNIQLDTMKGKSKTATGSSGGGTSIRFGGLRVNIKDEFWIRSPIFDIQPFGSIKLVGPQDKVKLEGKLEIKQGGKIYLLNNQFRIKSGVIEFGKNATFKEQSLEGNINPTLDIIAEVLMSHPKKTRAIIARIKGTMEDLANQRMQFEWQDTGGLTETEIMTTLGGGGLVNSTMEGGMSKALDSFKDFFARGFFDPLTSGVSEALGLEDLKIGFEDQQNFMVGVKTRPVFGGLSAAFEGNFDNKGTIKYLLTLTYQPGTIWGIRYVYDAKTTYAHEIRGEIGVTFDDFLKFIHLYPLDF